MKFRRQLRPLPAFADGRVYADLAGQQVHQRVGCEDVKRKQRCIKRQLNLQAFLRLKGPIPVHKEVYPEDGAKGDSVCPYISQPKQVVEGVEKSIFDTEA